MEVNKRARVIYNNEKPIANESTPTFQGELKSRKASDVIMSPQPWLWEPYIPLQTCTLVAGKGGIGKSQLLLFWCGLVSNGATFKIN